MSIRLDGGPTATSKTVTKKHCGNAAKQLQLHTHLRLQDQSIDMCEDVRKMMRTCTAERWYLH